MSEDRSRGRQAPAAARRRAPLRGSVPARGRPRAGPDGGRRRQARHAPEAVARGAVAMGAAGVRGARRRAGSPRATRSRSPAWPGSRRRSGPPRSFRSAIRSRSSRSRSTSRSMRARREAVVTATARITGQDRRRDGGADGGLRGVPRALRHDQGPRPRRGDPGDRAAGEVGRPLGRLPAGLNGRVRYRYLICDVFTDRSFGGNPLAVLPDARGLSEPPDAADRPRVQLLREHLRAAGRSRAHAPGAHLHADDGDPVRRVIPTSARPSPWPATGELGPARSADRR